MTRDIDSIRKFVDQYRRNGTFAVRLCCDVLLHIEGSPEQSRDGLLEFYRRVLLEIGSSVNFVKNGEGARFKRKSGDVADHLFNWFDRGGPQGGGYVLRLESGNQPDEVSDRAFEFSWLLGQGHVRFMLPVETAVNDPAAFRVLVEDMASLINFRSGTAGISANIHLDYDSSAEGGAISAIGQRYPGIDLGRPLYWSDLARHGLKTVNWLTLLGADMSARLIGADADRINVEAAMGANVELGRLGVGTIIQAGATPVFGDEKGELMYYAKVSQALALFSIPNQVLRGFDDIGGAENTKKWLSRFNQ